MLRLHQLGAIANFSTLDTTVFYGLSTAVSNNLIISIVAELLKYLTSFDLLKLAGVPSYIAI